MALLAAAWFLAIPASAADAPPAEPLTAEPLTASDVERFIATLPEVRALSEEYDAELVERERPADESGAGAAAAGTPFATAIDALDSLEMRQQLATLLASHDFASPEQWAQTGDRIVRAYVALHLDGQRDTIRRQMEQARRAIEANPNLSAEQKEWLSTRVATGAEMAVQFRAPDADKAAVRPYLSELEQALESEE